jgi:hypothetical protein
MQELGFVNLLPLLQLWKGGIQLELADGEALHRSKFYLRCYPTVDIRRRNVP